MFSRLSDLLKKLLSYKRVFLFSLFLNVIFLLFLLFQTLGVSDLSSSCANGEVIREFLRRQAVLFQNDKKNEESNIERYQLYKIFPVKMEGKPLFCGYVFLDRAVNGSLVLFADKDLNYLIIGDIIDVKNGKPLGYVNLPKPEELERAGECR